MTQYTSWFVGMKVVCLNGTPPQPEAGFGDEIWPVAGKVYTIREIGPLVSKAPHVVLVRLAEIVNVPRTYNLGFHEFAYVVRRFRPVQERKTDISIFQRLLLNPHVRIEEDA